MFGHNSDNRPDHLTPVSLPDGTYLTKVASQGSLVHGVDNNGNLWVWGSEIYAKGDEENFSKIYEGQFERESQPMRMKWLQEKNLQAIDVECGRNSALVKCKDKNGDIVFYGLCQSEEQIASIGGVARTSKVYNHFINKLDIDGNRVVDFAMT